MAAAKWEGKNQNTFTLFVENLSEKLHRQGLWHTFGRYGDVLDAFIARKRNRAGKRFGFVRFGKRIDAERAIERSNGFVLFRSRIRVVPALYKPRQSYWRKARTGNPENRYGGGKQSENMNLAGSGGSANPKVGGKVSQDSYEKERGECSSRNAGKCKRISGVVVEKEELWKLKRCMVGVMSTKVAELWGTFESLGGNAKHSMDCEIVSILITTNHEKRIEEAMEIEVGQNSCKASSDSSSESIRSKSRELETEGDREVEDEALIAVCTGKDYNNEDNVDTLVTNRHLGERDMRGDESKIERSLFSTINLDVGITDMSQKNREGISRNNNTDSWQKETSKEVGSERGQLVEEDSLAPQKITNRANIDPTHLQNQEEANREFGPESPQIHAMGGSGVLLLYGIETDAQFVMDPYNRDSWLNEGVILTLFLGKLLDEQESLASIWEDRSTIDLVDSSSWEDLVTSTTNPPTSSVGCWNHSQVRLLSPILD
ncbi:hypothetical protein V6N13_102128 [Hibiscus sabdariffa]